MDRTKTILTLGLLAALLLLAACGGDDDSEASPAEPPAGEVAPEPAEVPGEVPREPEEAPPTEEPTAEPAPEPDPTGGYGTADPAPAEEPPPVELEESSAPGDLPDLSFTFDGESCEYSGEDTIPAGVYSFSLVNEVGGGRQAFVVFPTIDEAFAVEDVLDEVGEAVEGWPEWVDQDAGASLEYTEIAMSFLPGTVAFICTSSLREAGDFGELFAGFADNTFVVGGVLVFE